AHTSAPENTSDSVALPLHPLAQHLAVTTHRLRLLAHAPLGRLLIGAPTLHLAEGAFALHLLLEHAQRGVDVVVADEYLHATPSRARNGREAAAGPGRSAAPARRRCRTRYSASER